MIIKLIITLIMTFTATLATANSETPEKNNKLPDYIIGDGVRQKTLELEFPLTEEDKKDIDTLERKFDQEEVCVGLAAPQIGIFKRFIIFQVLDDPQLKKWRPDLTQFMPKTIWFNPTFEPLGEETNEDFEGCFSIPDMAGSVKRYKKIKYRAYDINGNLITGIAEGFLARVIQHEVDHLNGKLFIDYVAKENLLTMEEYQEKRKKAMQE